MKKCSMCGKKKPNKAFYGSGNTYCKGCSPVYQKYRAMGLTASEVREKHNSELQTASEVYDLSNGIGKKKEVNIIAEILQTKMFINATSISAISKAIVAKYEDKASILVDLPELIDLNKEISIADNEVTVI